MGDMLPLGATSPPDGLQTKSAYSSEYGLKMDEDIAHSHNVTGPCAVLCCTVLCCAVRAQKRIQVGAEAMHSGDAARGTVDGIGNAENC